MKCTVDTLAAMVRDVAKVLNTPAPSKQILQRCTELVVSHLDAAFARVWTYNPEQGYLELVASGGLYTHFDAHHARIEMGKFKIGLIASERQPHFTNDVQHDPRASNLQWARENGITSFAGYPLIVGDELIGVIGVFSKNPFSQQTLACLEAIGDSIAGFLQRRREEERHKLSQLIFQDFASHCDDVFWIFDLERGRYSYSSPACNVIFELTEEEVCNDPLALVNKIVEEDRARIVSFLDDVRQNPRYADTEYRVNNEKGNVRFIWSRVFPLPDGNGRVNRIAGIAHDVTERKEAEVRVNQFYSTVSHELRTPIASIQGALSLIKHDRVGKDDARELISIAHQECRRLTRLVNDILDLRKIEAGKLSLHLAEVHVEHSFNQMLNSLRNLAGEKNITLRSQVDADLMVTADPDRLSQVITNLVANAIKFSPPQSRVDVLAKAIPCENVVRFEVRDNGTGIKASDLCKLFTLYSQLDSADNRQNSGTGLGLAVSKALVETHGGRIGVESEEGAGSTFWFELPAAAEIKSELRTELHIPMQIA